MKTMRRDPVERSKQNRIADLDSKCTRQDKTRQVKTRQDKTRQVETRHDTTRHDKTRQDKTSPDETRQDKTRRDETRQDKIRQNKTRQDKRPTKLEAKERSRMIVPLRYTFCRVHH